MTQRLKTLGLRPDFFLKRLKHLARLIIERQDEVSDEFLIVCNKLIFLTYYDCRNSGQKNKADKLLKDYRLTLRFREVSRRRTELIVVETTDLLQVYTEQLQHLLILRYVTPEELNDAELKLVNRSIQRVIHDFNTVGQKEKARQLVSEYQQKV